VVQLADNRKTMSIRLDPEAHQELKIQLAKDNITFQEWAENKIKEYINWEGKEKNE